MAETQGIITLKVPPTKKADLYVVAVDDRRQEAVWFGVKRNIAIQGEATIQIRMEDLDWVQANWELEGFIDLDTGNRIQHLITREDNKTIITLPKESSRVEVVAQVSDPFQPGEPGPWEELFIKLEGVGYVRSTIDGKREMYSRFKNPKPGQANETVHLGFQPVLASQMFYLSTLERYKLPPVGWQDAVVRWE